jgi:hypothetical protein
MSHCPLCQSKRTHLSRRRGILERIFLASIFVRPIRCEKCDLRFYRWSFPANPQASRRPTAHGFRSPSSDVN